MKIPIYCERCGKLIATFDTAKDSSVEWAEAPCGEKVCEECCAECAKNDACMYREEAHIDGRKT